MGRNAACPQRHLPTASSLPRLVDGHSCGSRLLCPDAPSRRLGPWIRPRRDIWRHPCARCCSRSCDHLQGIFRQDRRGSIVPAGVRLLSQYPQPAFQATTLSNFPAVLAKPCRISRPVHSARWDTCGLPCTAGFDVISSPQRPSVRQRCAVPCRCRRPQKTTDGWTARLANTLRRPWRRRAPKRLVRATSGDVKIEPRLVAGDVLRSDPHALDFAVDGDIAEPTAPALRIERNARTIKPGKRLRQDAVPALAARDL